MRVVTLYWLEATHYPNSLNWKSVSWKEIEEERVTTVLVLLCFLDVALLKSQTESDLQGGEHEELNYVFGTKVQSDLQGAVREELNSVFET